MANRKLRVKVSNLSGSKIVAAELPADAKVRRLVQAWVTKMELPKKQNDTPLIYRFQHKQSGKELQDNDTLASAGVKEGDTLRLLVKIEGGSFL